jgi:hypothetical protein
MPIQEPTINDDSLVAAPVTQMAITTQQPAMPYTDYDNGYFVGLADGEAAQLATDKAAVTAGKADILTTRTILTIQGTYSPDFPDVANVLTSDTVDGSAGTYDATNLTVGNVKKDVTFGVSSTGTYDPMAAAVFPAAANVEVAETAYGPTGAEYAGALDLAAAEAAAASTQHDTDAAFLETNKAEIIPDDTAIQAEFGVTGTAEVGGGGNRATFIGC